MASGVYVIENKLNGKRYVGSAVDLKVRRQGHKRALLRGTHINIHLQNSWNKHGDDTFEFDVIEYWEPEFLVGMEQWWMNMLKPEYNICKVAGSNLGVKHTAESKANMSKAMTGNTNCLGYKQTDEHKANMSAAMKGHIVTAETRAKIGKAHKGRKFSAESKAKMSAAKMGHTGYKHTDEARANMSKAWKGRPWSEARRNARGIR